ncbi:polysaccharide pyruvyl transferase CsaB [Thermohalobacter berrensis]|uniref:Polysaccharide pyruvyl transferase CsaB n=1 Tax=Thermohalobacter berrensis TaxID=99594 RepID=A0A419SXZ5_9FIRM|nr:polysaccharide pyruvyl transferase CsaB [Thermohalobacter berrensis]RKD30078.1 polysaccharide pyruvyl transferase CsaB [Thermohalobacter berrensis]
MKENKKIIISGYYGFDNSGDDAILKAIVKDLKSQNNNIEITALSRKPLDTKKNYNINAINRFSVIEVIRGLYNCDMLISGGGSLLQDITSTRSLIYYLALIFIAKFFRKNVVIYANGIGPIKKRINKLLTKKVLNNVDLITVRDYNSQKTLKEIGVENKNVHVTSDPVFTLQLASEKRIFQILKEEGIPTDKPLIGVAVREWKNNKKLREVISRAIDYLNDNYNVNIVLLPMHYPNDLKISKEIKKLAKTKCYIISKKYSVEDVMGIINKLEIIIAMRLHSLIYAATQAVPMVGIVYDPKVKGFLDQVGLETGCNVDDLEVVDLCTIIDDVWNNRKQIKNKLIKVKKELKEKAYDNVKMVMKLLESR